MVASEKRTQSLPSLSIRGLGCSLHYDGRETTYDNPNAEESGLVRPDNEIQAKRRHRHKRENRRVWRTDSIVFSEEVHSDCCAVDTPNARDEWRRATGNRMQPEVAIRRPLHRAG